MHIFIFLIAFIIILFMLLPKIIFKKISNNLIKLERDNCNEDETISDLEDINSIIKSLGNSFNIFGIIFIIIVIIVWFISKF